MSSSILGKLLPGLVGSVFAATVTFAPAGAQQEQRPNIVIIWGDDIGQSDVSAYSHGLMGFKTPNIDRIAKEGVMFTDYYAEQSCTAGRSSFITGQSGLRTGMTKVGLPGATLGLQKEDPTIAELLKPLGYATANSARTISATATNSCPPSTASMSSMATFTI
jgi:arylsulfatase A-like enzyme